MKASIWMLCFASAAAFAFAQENRKTNSAAEQAARAAVEKGHDAFIAAMRADNVNGVVALLAPDVVFSPPNSARLVGPAAVRSWYQGVVSQAKTTNVAISDRTVTVAGDHAIEEGQFVWAVVPKGAAATVENRGKFLAVWQRQSDGSWKVTRDIWNTSLPSQGVQANTADPWIGWWVLNVEKTRINPGPKARAETRSYAAMAEGERATYDVIEADGKRVYSTSTYRFDGRDVPVVGDPEVHTQAITRTSPRSIASIIKKAGQVVRTATREVSADGKTLTVQFKGTNPRGQPIVEEVWVFDRRSEPWLGTWELAQAKSRLAPDQTPKFDLRTFVPTARGEVATYLTIEPDGKPLRSDCTFEYNGVDAPVVAGTPGETLAFTRMNANALAVIRKIDGKVVSTATRAVSDDGNTLTVTVKNVDPARTDEVWVFERRNGTSSREDVMAEVKAAVVTHWSAINGAQFESVSQQHRSDLTVVAVEFEHRVARNTPVGLALLSRYEGSTANWSLRDVEVHAFGNSAVATFYLDGSIRYADGAVDARSRRATEYWVNDGSVWKEAHHHDSVYAANPKVVVAP